jgi:hypothetical protein
MEEARSALLSIAAIGAVGSVGYLLFQNFMITSGTKSSSSFDASNYTIDRSQIMNPDSPFYNPKATQQQKYDYINNLFSWYTTGNDDDKALVTAAIKADGPEAQTLWNNKQAYIQQAADFVNANLNNWVDYASGQEPAAVEQQMGQQLEQNLEALYETPAGPSIIESLVKNYGDGGPSADGFSKIYNAWKADYNIST